MKKLIYLFLITFISFNACTNPDSSEVRDDGISSRQELINVKLESTGFPRPEDSYNYPVRPGMDEWAKFETVEEMVEACQVPKDILKTISTQAVLQALWEYPFLSEVVHRDEYQRDFEGVFSGNNAYNELIGRTDAGAALLRRLYVHNPENTIERYKIKPFEVLMSQTVLLSQLNGEAKNQLIEVTLINDSFRQKDDERTNLNRATAWLLIGKTLVSANYAPFIKQMNEDGQLKLFIESPTYTYLEDVYGDIPAVIIKHAEIYLTGIKK
jgi:hypothetical protein